MKPEADRLVALERDRAELIEVLRSGVDLVDGNLVGADWKLACHGFSDKASALLSRLEEDNGRPDLRGCGAGR